MPDEVLRPGDTHRGEFPTHNATGAAANADSLPTATYARNGVSDNLVAVTITNIDTGLYAWSAVVPDNYAAGDWVGPRITAVIGTLTKRLLFSPRPLGEASASPPIPPSPPPPPGVGNFGFNAFDFLAAESLVPGGLTGIWQQYAYLFETRRPTANNQIAGTATATEGSELFLALDVSALLESKTGGATIVQAGCIVTAGGAVVTTPLAKDPTGTKVGTMFTDFVAGVYLVFWSVVLSDGSQRTIPGELVVVTS